MVFEVEAQQLGAALQGGQFGRLDLAVSLGNGQHNVQNGQRFGRGVRQVAQFFLGVLAQDASA